MKGLCITVLAIVSTCVGATAFAQRGDERILAARDALRTNDRPTLERLAAISDNHPLDHYVEYWLLIARLEHSDPPPVGRLNSFLERHPDSVPGDRLRAYWLKRMAKEADWTGFLRLYSERDGGDPELRCQAWHARYVTGDARVLAEVAQAWRDLVASHAACDTVLRATVAAGKVGEDDVWWRFRRQIDSRTPETARTTLSWLGGGESQGRDLGALLKNPGQYLERLPSDFAASRTSRELAIAALVRLIREEEALAGYVRFLRLRDDLGDEERDYLHVVLGHHGALSRLPQAAEWYGAASSNATMTQAQRSWRVRAALRIEDWLGVEHAIRFLDADEQTDPEWIFWRARARAEQGFHEEARDLYKSIAGETHFYGILATEELGGSFTLPSHSDVVAPEDRSRAANDPGVQRALAFYRLDMPTEGVREWIRALRNQDRAFLVAAAHLALESGLYDRAINTAELADPRANFDIRFPTPFRELIEPQVRRQALDLAWVYGLMRQESRFIIPARSSAGAQGLMQVMPATGKWVAQRIGMNGYHPRMLNDPNTNVLLGTSYMRIIMGDLDNHPVLASAGYNAGPGRAQRWRGERPLDATIYTATIPFDETRDYVKKVLANKIVYATMLEQRPQSLKARLGLIHPRAGQ